MKLLVIGIDAADYRIIEKMNMPFMQKLIAASLKAECKEDLLSRGWAEIYTGRHASETCAFYDRPLLDGTVAVTQSFTTKNLDKDIVPLWTKLNQLGKRVGIMNIPTTYPAEKVDGFMVAGGGGGLNRLKKIGSDLCYPQSYANELERGNYIPDLRLTTSGITDIEHFFDSYRKMVERRVKAFVDLTQKDTDGIDFGFIAFRALAIIQYLGMAEFEYLIDSENKPEGEPGSGSNRFRGLMQDFYRFFDAQIELLMSTLNPSNYIFVADHGQVPYLYDMNCNAFLIEAGYQLKKTHMKRTQTVNLLRKMLPAFIKNQILKQFKNVVNFTVDFDLHASTAFSLGLINGIYLNDSRFWGRVSDNKRQNIVRKICDDLNSASRADEFNLRAIPYREKFSVRYDDFLPDIFIQKPDTIRPMARGEFVARNQHYGFVECLTDVYDDNWTGIKNSAAMCFMSNDLSLYHETKHARLTDIYNTIINIYR